MRYATKNPYSYVHANIAGHVTLLEAIKEQEVGPPALRSMSYNPTGLAQNSGSWGPRSYMLSIRLFQTLGRQCHVAHEAMQTAAGLFSCAAVRATLLNAGC